MRLTLRGTEIELKPLTFKDWVEAEKQGLDISRLSVKKKCQQCEGAGKDGATDCAPCNGTGRVANVKMQDIWYIVNMTLMRAGVPDATINDLSLQEVMDVFGDGTIVNFISAKAPSV